MYWIVLAAGEGIVKNRSMRTCMCVLCTQKKYTAQTCYNCQTINDRVMKQVPKEKWDFNLKFTHAYNDENIKMLP